MSLLVALAVAPSGAGAEEKKRSVRRPAEAERWRRLEKLEREVARLRALVQEREEGTSARPVPREAESGDSLAALRAAAREALREGDDERTEELPTFRARGLALQQLNPEISTTGDFAFLTHSPAGTVPARDFLFRNLGVHVESYLDPYTRFKAAVPVTEGGVSELGEAYVTRYGFRPRLALTLGKFRQQFGVVNRWHKHGLDQWDFPLALRRVFGDGGLNSSGLDLTWTLPSKGKVHQESCLQLTDGSNGVVFAENGDASPAWMLRHRWHVDVDADRYFELGLSILRGKNQDWGLAGGGTLSLERDVEVRGLDLAYLWEPAGRMRHRSVIWRGELYHLRKDVVSPTAGLDELHAWGGFTYLESKVDRCTSLGLRYDHFVPDVKSWADGSSFLAVPAGSPRTRAIAPYVTWWQSPFVRYRVEWNRSWNEDTGLDDEKRFIFQVTFAAGPHKHERY